MKQLQWILLGIALTTAAFFLIMASPNAQAWTSGDVYGGSGDWTINNPTVVGDDAGITVNGNLIINSKLEVYNSIIRINCGSDMQYMVNVTSTGTLQLWGGSTLTAVNGNYHYPFLDWGTLDINQSTVSEMWGDTASWTGGIQIYGSGAKILNSNITYGMTGGIYVWNVSASICNNWIYNNGAGGSTIYCYGIYVSTDGNGTSTSTKIDGNLVYNNYYASGTTRYGYGIYSQFQNTTDQITNNQIYDNGFSTTGTNNGIQLYLQYSNATVTDNALRNGSYQLYAYGSSPPTLKNLNISSYARMSANSYGVYAYNSTLSFKKCDWYAFSCAYNMYGVYANGPSVNSSSRLDFVDCTFNYSITGSYTRYFIYANAYTPTNITSCTFVNMYGSTIYGIYARSYSPVNITSSDFNTTYGSTTYLVYATSYCPLAVTGSDFNISLNTGSPSFFYTTTYCPTTIERCTFEANGTWTSTNFFYGSSYCNYTVNYSRIDIWMSLGSSSSAYFYGFQVRSYSMMWFSWSTLNYTMDNLTLASYPYLYPLYVYQYGLLAVDNSSVTVTFGDTYPNYGYNYPIYAYYTPAYINNSSIRSLNDKVYYTYGVYCYYASLRIESSYIELHKVRGYMMYAIYNYGYSGRGDQFQLTNSTLIANNSINSTLYSSPYTYWYVYYCDILIYNTRCDLRAGQNIYIYMYGYSGGNLNLLIANSSFTLNNSIPDSTFSSPNAYGLNCYYFANAIVENNTYDINCFYNFYGNQFYYSNPTIRNNVYRIRQNVTGRATVSGYGLYVYDYNSQYFCLVDNCTFDYESWSTAANGPYLFYMMGGRSQIQNTTVNIRTLNGTVPVLTFYVYYGAKVNVENMTVNALYGMTIPSGGNPGFNFLYQYNPSSYPNLFNMSNSTVNIKLANDPYLHNGFYIYGANDQLNLYNTTVRWNITSPDTTLRVLRFYDDPGNPGRLNQLSIVKTTFIVEVSGANSQVFFLKMGAGTGISKTIISEANLTATFYTASSYPVNLVELVGIRGVTLADLVLNLNAPAGSDMVLNGIKLDRSTVTVSNVTIKGNGQGRITGIVCDLVSRPTISNVTVTGAYIGIHSTFYSEPEVTGVKISDCTYGLLVNDSSNGTLSLSDITARIGVGVADGSWVNLIDCPLDATEISVELDGGSTAWCLNATLKKEPVFRDASSTLIVNWPMQIKVLWKDREGKNSERVVPNAEVLVNDRPGTEVLRAATNSEGLVPWQTVVEYTQVKAGKTFYSPYTVKATSSGFTGQDSIAVSGPTEAVIYITDDSLPSVSILEPSSGRVQNFKTVRLRGTAADLGSGMEALLFSFDGVNWATAPASATWEYLMEVEEGTRELKVKVRDLAGNEAEASVSVVIDLTRPNIDITSPANGSLGNVIGVDLIGKVEAGSYLTINHIPVGVGADGAFSFPAQLVEGRNYFQLFARDRADNTNSTSWALFLDITPPRLTVTGPAEGLLTNLGTVQVTGKTEPGAVLTIGHTTVPLDADGSFSHTLALERGTNRITVVAADSAGNNVTELRTVLMDNEVRLEISYPEADLTTNQITILVQGTTDGDALLRLNDGLVSVGAGGAFSVTYTLSEGTNLLTLKATDRAGNSREVLLHVILDTTRPALQVTSPAPGSLLKTDQISVTGRCEPDINLTVNGEPVPTGDGTFSRTFALQEGTNIITVEGSDRAGNTVSVQVSVVVDTRPPALDIVEPLDGFRTNDFSVIVVGITEPGAHVTVNDLPVVVDAFGKFATTVALQKGKNSIKVTTTDSAGNGQSMSITATQTSPPAAAAGMTSWWWTAVGLLLAIGFMFPLTMLVVSIGLKSRRRPMEGFK